MRVHKYYNFRLWIRYLTRYWSTVARLKRGVSLPQANAEMATRQEAWFQEFFSARERRRAGSGTRMIVESARTGLPTFESNAYVSPVALMQGLAGIVLLLCCVNGPRGTAPA